MGKAKKIMEYTPVDNPDQICLSRHMLIEASAGTGKTYTIENLVVRFLEEREDLAIENLLLVTFTEKATSELKQRIRHKLRERVQDLPPGPAAGRLEDALAAFDTASIFTIHGFCQNVLADYAFENGTLFQNELVDDWPLFESQFKEHMRAGWRRRYGDDLADMLTMLGLPQNTSDFMKTMCQVAADIYRPQAGDLLLPDIAERSFAAIRQSLEDSLMQLQQAVGRSFADNFVRLNFNATARKSIMAKIVSPLEDYLSEVCRGRLDMRALAELMGQIGSVKSQDRSGIDCLVPDKWTKKGENLRDCPQLPCVVQALKDLTAELRLATCFLSVDTVKRLQADVAAIKETRGWISYNDMLTRVHQALCSAGGKALLTQLRRRYRVAFVDEFQDTDPVQWQIFKKIFLSSGENAGGILGLIGDPKQAIYGFRGADVYAYLVAREEMHRLAARGQAGLYSLSTNWRSDDGLVWCFNRLFTTPGWFKQAAEADAFDIAYRDSLAAPVDKRRLEFSRDNSGRPSLTVVDLSRSRSLVAAKTDMAAFVAAEIDNLINVADICIARDNGIERPFDAGDICILVRGKSDVVPLEQALSQRRIPFIYYKKPGLFFSEEADSLALVLHAISNPADAGAVKKALLTPFFNLPADMVNLWEELAPDHLIRILILEWNGLARERRWSRLFQSLMEDSGLICRQSADPQWDRQQTNYQQIFESLQIEAYRRNLDFRGLCALFDGWRRQSLGAGEDADIHQIETDERKVQVMTIHVSKGLEFPVVFLAGGLTRHGGTARHTVYHRMDTANGHRFCTKIIDLGGGSGAEQQQIEDQEEEKRLFYVALTRSRFKLYVPYLPFDGKQKYVGTVPRLLSPALEKAFGDDCWDELLWIRPDEPVPKQKTANDEIIVKAKDVPTKGNVSRPPFAPVEDHRHKKPRMNSFSSLHSAVDAPPGNGFEGVDTAAREDDESFAAPLADGSPDEQTLPGGTHTGSMLHAILENIDFQKVAVLTGGQVEDAATLLKGGPTAVLIREQMRTYGTHERFETQVCRLVAGALLCPLPEVQNGFCLAALGPDACRSEVEFLYPVSFSPDPAMKVPECRCGYGEGAFIRGFVDLIFRWQGKYYIADWKSNLVEAGYGREFLQANMDRADYHLQYMIYTVAMCRWLVLASGGRFQPRRDFGGVLYLYLRGMPEGKGVYFVPGDQLDNIASLEARIHRRLRAAAWSGGK